MSDSEWADRLIHVALTLILPVHRSLNVGDEAGRDDVLSTVFLIQYRQPSVKLEQKISLNEETVGNQAGTRVASPRNEENQLLDTGRQGPAPRG